MGRSGSKGIKAVFKQIDTNGDGTLDKHEFLAGMAILGVSLSPTDVELIWYMFVSDSTFDSSPILYHQLTFLYHYPGTQALL
jgi:Ca2+-binding EF-hand superfamily protein